MKLKLYPSILFIVNKSFLHVNTNTYSTQKHTCTHAHMHVGTYIYTYTNTHKLPHIDIHIYTHIQDDWKELSVLKYF